MSGPMAAVPLWGHKGLTSGRLSGLQNVKNTQNSVVLSLSHRFCCIRVLLIQDFYFQRVVCFANIRVVWFYVRKELNLCDRQLSSACDWTFIGHI